MLWAEQHLKMPVIDHWWQTETGWAIAGNPIGIGLLPVKRGSPTLAMPGYDVRVLDDGGHPVADGKLGNIAIKLPLPPGCLPTLWDADARFGPSYLAEFPVTTRRRMPATATPTAISSSWAAPTTSSTSPGTGYRPARWKRCWPPTRTWRSAP